MTVPYVLGLWQSSTSERARPDRLELSLQSLPRSLETIDLRRIQDSAQGSIMTVQPEHWKERRPTVYHASGQPTLRTGSIITPPPKVRVTLPYGHGVSATPYAREDSNGWTPRLLRDVERRASAKREARRTRTSVRGSAPSRTEVERTFVPVIKMGEMD